MNYRLIIAAIFLCFLLIPSLRAETPPAGLAELDARIQELETSLIQAQADRYRAKHKLEYEDDGASALRKEAKAREKELLDLRAAYDDRLRVIDAGLRAQEKEIGRLNKESSDFSQLAEAIRRELTAAEQGGSTNAAEQLAVLKDELAQAEAQMVDRRDRGRTLLKEWSKKKEQVAAADGQASALRDEIIEKEKSYLEAFGQLNQTLDESADVQALDQRRQQIGAELQSLRQQRVKLLEETKGR